MSSLEVISSSSYDGGTSNRRGVARKAANASFSVTRIQMERKNKVTLKGMFVEPLKRVVAGDTQCRLFCGGVDCKYDTYEYWVGRADHPNNAFPGVYSNWINESILATARPTTPYIERFDLINAWSHAGISTIINLQDPGEHPYCGPCGLERSGFAYDPQVFMDAGMMFYNFGWKDFGVPTMNAMLNMVRVFEFALSGDGKVAVHCHAGLGRTGLLIACAFVFIYRLNPQDAVDIVRKKRTRAIQTVNQATFVEDFHTFLRPLRVVFCNPCPHATTHLISYKVSFPAVRRSISDDRTLAADINTSSKLPSTTIPCFTLKEALRRQRAILHGDEGRQLRHIPKVLYLCIRALNSIIRRRGPGVRARIARHIVEAKGETWSHEFAFTLDNVRLSANSGNWKPLINERDPLVFCHILLTWLEDLSEPIIDIADPESVVAFEGNLSCWLDMLPHSKDIRNTLKLLAQFLVNLYPLDTSLELHLVERLIEAITHHHHNMRESLCKGCRSMISFFHDIALQGSSRNNNEDM